MIKTVTPCVFLKFYLYVVRSVKSGCWIIFYLVCCNSVLWVVAVVFHFTPVVGNTICTSGFVPSDWENQIGISDLSSAEPHWADQI